MNIPKTDNLALIRTSFSSEESWRSLLEEAHNPPEPFMALFAIVDDPHFTGKSTEEVIALLPADYPHEAIFIVDERALTEEGHPCLVVGPLPNETRTFRVLARQVASIDSNLSIANMGFEEFEQASAPEGIFRGFE